MIASRKSIIVTKPERTACSLADLSEENAMILDNLEEYEERISRIEYCLNDLCFALRRFVASKDFSKLQKEFRQTLENQGSEQGGACSRAESRRASGKEARSALRPDLS